jgi:hypothetical protein
MVGTLRERIVHVLSAEPRSGKRPVHSLRDLALLVETVLPAVEAEVLALVREGRVELQSDRCRLTDPAYQDERFRLEMQHEDEKNLWDRLMDKQRGMKWEDGEEGPG